jgi:Fe-S cluster assembly ATP-binding protein
MKHTDTLTVSRVQAAIGSKDILRDLSLTVKSGEVHAIMGPNGSGKSTLAYAMMGHRTKYLVHLGLR